VPHHHVGKKGGEKSYNAHSLASYVSIRVLFRLGVEILVR